MVSEGDKMDLEKINVNKRTVWAALLMFAAAYVYIDSLLFGTGMQHGFSAQGVKRLVFTAFFVGMTELLCIGKPQSAESNIWLGCLLCAAMGSTFFLNCSVWDCDQCVLFMHVFGVYWALSRGNVLLEGESGHLAFFDGLNGFIVLPFKNLFVRIRVILGSLRERRKNRPQTDGEKVVWTFMGVLVSLGILVTVIQLLSDSDSVFSELMKNIRDFFTIDFSYQFEENLIKFVLSLPVGCYLFSLLYGCGFEKPEWVENYRRSVQEGFLDKLKKLPCSFWIGVMGLFSVVYAVYFVIQGRYLFGAFTRTLPEGFIVSRYARQGFFELCKVTGLNFALLWLVTRISREDVREHKLLSVSCLVFLCECALFCIIALSKLGLYISCFGFTPLRLQSSWLVCVLLAACGLWMFSILFGRKTFKLWMYFGGISLALLCLI